MPGFGRGHFRDVRLYRTRQGLPVWLDRSPVEHLNKRVSIDRSLRIS